MKKIQVLIVLVLILALAGCGTISDTSSTASPNATKEDAKATGTPATETSAPNAETPSATEDTKEKMIELPIYGINDETQESEDIIAYIPEGSEITAEFIVNEVVKVFKEHSIEIGIDHVKQENDNVYVSFKPDTPPSSTIGSGVEGTILDSIAKSLLDNLGSCKNVIYRIEDKSYTSGHFEFGYDEPYLWR